MKRSTLYWLVALVPLVLIWAFALSYDPTRYTFAKSSIAAPKWVGDVPPITYYNCDQAITGTPSTKSVTIDFDRAARIGAGVIQSQTHPPTLPKIAVVTLHRYWSSVSFLIINRMSLGFKVGTCAPPSMTWKRRLRLFISMP